MPCPAPPGREPGGLLSTLSDKVGRDVRVCRTVRERVVLSLGAPRTLGLLGGDTHHFFFSPREKPSHLLSPPSLLHSPAALNPTYTYGKRPDSPPHPDAVAAAAAASAAGTGGGGTPPPGWVAATDAGSLPSDAVPARRGHPLPTYGHHGHRGSLITARLPSVGAGLGDAGAAKG